jgi:hypothetical protein
MAVTTITPVVLVMDTESADLPDASGTAITAGVDGFSIAATPLSEGYSGNMLIKMFEAGGTAGVVVFNAGVKPPSIRADLGPLSVSMAAGDARMISIEQARYTQADGTITGIITGVSVDDITMTVFRLPRNV